MKKLVYLISPDKINKHFYKDLDKVLSYGNTKFFQLRLKNIKKNKILKVGKAIRKITNKHKVYFIINDKYNLVPKMKADGCHMGQPDGSTKIARKIIKQKILGITCHNSKRLALRAYIDQATYLAFGSFFKSKLKPNARKANLSILKWSKKNINIPIVAIGGINNLNYKKLLKSGAKYIAISSFIWNNPKQKPFEAIKEFNL